MRHICYTGFEGGGKVCSFIESESEVKVTQLCQTLCNSVDCSPWNSPVQNAGVGSLFLLQGIFPTQGSNWGLLHCKQILYQLNYQGSLHKYVSIFFQVIFPLRLLQNTEQSSLCYIVGPCLLPTVYIAVRTHQSQTP